jgi:large subunit ribosomal protein L6e
MVKKVDWYKADDEKVHFKRKTPKPTKLKHNIVPGQVLVILVGQFKGKRVVFLKQLPSGMLLVTGPYRVNGVPLRRIPQKYTLTTSKTIDVAGVKTDKVTDDFFRKVRVSKGSKEAQFFAKDKKEGKDSAAANKVNTHI